MNKNEQSLRNLYNPMAYTSIYTIKVPESEEEKKKGRWQKQFWRMAKNFSNMMEDTNLHIQEAQQTPSKINSRRYTQRYIIVKLSKDKEFCKHQERSNYHKQSIFIRLTPDFSYDIL